jgi:hypothetical protein
MTRIDPTTWQKIENTHPSGEKYLARRGLPEVTERLFCAIDSGGTRHLLVLLKNEEDELHDEISRGVAVDTLEMVVQGQPSAKYIDIECRENTGYSILDLMGGEIAEGLRDSKRQAAEIVHNILAKWRRFWGQIPQHLMSREEQLGLFAELWYLSKWVIPKQGSKAVFSWRGPWKSRNDFEWNDKSVEVKATTNTHGRILRINGIRQLEEPENGSLYLFSVILREEAGAANNLPSLIENCSELLKDDPDAISYFEDGLAKAGYSPVHEDDYSSMHLVVLETALFMVNQDFPRITRSSFTEGPLVGIEEIIYVINLNTYNHLIVATQPYQMPF